MQTMKKDRDLLDTLQRLVGCEYLSDLKSEPQRGRLLQVMRDMDLASFTLEEWESAISYLFRRSVSFHSLEELRAFVEQDWFNM